MAPSKLKISELKATAHLRPEGFVEAVLTRGVIEGDEVGLDDAAVTELRMQFPDPRPQASAAPPPALRVRPPATFHIPQLKASAAQRPEGFVEFVLTRARIEGEYAYLDNAAVSELRRKFPLRPVVGAPLAPNGRYRLDNIKAAAANRPPGYVEFVLAKGRVEGDSVILDEAMVREIQEKFPATNQPVRKPRPPEPTVAEMAANFTLAMAGWVKAGFKVVEREVYESRHATCLACNYWDAQARGGLGKCKRCGCSRAKLWLINSKCPLTPPKW